MRSKRAGNGGTRRRTPRGERAERRADILRIATDAFATKGYNKASLAEISERAGLTQAGVLHHFPSKEALLTGVLDLRDASAITELGDERPHGLDFLRHLVDTIRRNTGREGIVQLYAVLSAESVTDDHPAQGYFRDRYDGLRTILTEALEEARALGEVEESLDAGAVAVSVIAVMDGLQVQWLLDPERVDMAASTRLTIERLAGVDLSAGPGGGC